ncbi:hypothetical protein TWF718_000853 [Orbilia javanica]|uniref:Uncharacterized protein n=1 Tax=Orbilia javanica TaxID=47235 RepID=A0AAN8NGI2_9PEZI
MLDEERTKGALEDPTSVSIADSERARWFKGSLMIHENERAAKQGSADLEKTLTGESTNATHADAPDSELKSLEEKATEAMENVYYLLEAAERRDAVTQNAEIALRSIKARLLAPDTEVGDDSNSGSDSSDSDSSDSASDSDPDSESNSDSDPPDETGSNQSDLSEDDIDSEASYTEEEEWSSGSTTTPEPNSAPSALRRTVKSPGRRAKDSNTKSLRVTKSKNVSERKGSKSEHRNEKKNKKELKRQQVKRAEDEFLEFLDRMVRELDNLRVLGKSSTDLFLKQYEVKEGTEALGDKLQQAKLASKFRDSVERMIIELFRIGLPHSGCQISTADAEVIAKCALIVGIKQGVGIQRDEFEEAIVDVTDAIVRRLSKREEPSPDGHGLRGAPAAKSVAGAKSESSPEKTDLGAKPTKRYFGWATKFFQPSGKTPGFIPPSEDTRDFTIKDDWTEKDLQAETVGRHPFIDPEVKIVLRSINDAAREACRNNERYIWGCEYLESDLKNITIGTLPSNGKVKPAHNGPEGPAYYHKFTSRLFSSINTWVERYILPTRRTASIKINSPAVLPAIKQTLRKFDYFEESDFIVPKGEKSLKSRNEKRKIKRQMFFQYLFYQVLYENIWSRWLYGMNKDMEAHVLELAGLEETEKHTKKGHLARGRWFTDNIRRKPTHMAQRILDLQAHLATTLRQLFVPLLNSNNEGPKPDKRRMCISAEKELMMIISDAQALQIMFQSEITVNRIIFGWPGQSFDKRLMINAASNTEMRRLGYEPVPGKDRGLTKEDKVDFVFQPGLFIDEATEIYEHIVVA